MDIIFWITIFVLIIASAYDVRFRRIPNWLTLPAVVAGAAYHTYTAGLPGFLLSAGGLLVGFCVFFIFYVVGG
ncbi:MAG: Type IV leader peptidase family protein [Syntrophorhabdus sp. PtaU1.Bin153]|nr:MAG: Type IV leader peptidase family protein [Syntrophorhabdus sp. PtaU1.Bin153]